ncbi:MAG TPA: hypothetical protein VF705_02625 [Longimicrobium sp.]
MRILKWRETEWTVWDVFPTFEARMRMTGESADLLVQGWLVFQCELEKRRLGPIPEGWDALPDEDLVELLESASLVQRRPGEADGPYPEALG